MTRDAPSPPGDPASKLENEILDQLRGLETQATPELVAQVLDAFLQDTSSRLIALRDALDRRDGDAAYQASHAMQGSAAMVGVTSMADCCRELARAARAGSFDRCEVLAAELETGFQAAQRAVARARSR